MSDECLRENRGAAVAGPGTPGAKSLHGVVIGILTGVDDGGRPLVAFAGNPSSLPVAARSIGDVDPGAAGREVALLFEEGDPRKPLLIGVLQSGRSLVDRPGEVRSQSCEPADNRESPGEAVRELHVASLASNAAKLSNDDERVDIEAREQIVLRCGKASITLTRAGKVIVRGAYISTLSSGANRIRGGSVQIN